MPRRERSSDAFRYSGGGRRAFLALSARLPVSLIAIDTMEKKPLFQSSKVKKINFSSKLPLDCFPFLLFHLCLSSKNNLLSLSSLILVPRTRLSPLFLSPSCLSSACLPSRQDIVIAERRDIQLNPFAANNSQTKPQF